MNRGEITSMKKTLSEKQLAWVLTLVYFTSYLTRVNLGAIIQEIITDTGFLKSELSIVLVGMSIAYGAGQLITGYLGDKISPHTLIGLGLLCAAGINLVFPFASHSRAMMCVLWSLNGFCHAMLWPPMTKIMAARMDQEMYGYTAIRVSWGSSFATIAIYLFSPLVLISMGWRPVFWICATVGILVSIVWFLLRDSIGYTFERRVYQPNAKTSQKAGGIGGHFVLPLVVVMMAIVLQGMIRDGVTAWMPTYLSEVFRMENSVSIFSTVTLAIFSIICVWGVGKIYARFFNNEVLCASMLFGICAAASLVFLLFFNAGPILAMLLMALMTGTMHGVNLMLISYIPKRFFRTGRVSTVSGMVNSCTYIGASISTYGIAKIAEIFGWRANIVVWLAVTLLGTVLCLMISPRWRRALEIENAREEKQ